MIIAGYSAYSWVPDWKKFREIADEVGAYFLADISHIGGLVAAGVIPSPIGFAHVTMSTTHKSLDGPRGAVLLTTQPDIAKKLDKAVFPGEQGGARPHLPPWPSLSSWRAQFKKLQAQTIKNAQAMVAVQKRGLRVPFGGTGATCSTSMSPASRVLMAQPSAATKPRILMPSALAESQNPSREMNATDPAALRRHLDHPARLAQGRSWPTSWPMFSSPAHRTPSNTPQGPPAARKVGLQCAQQCPLARPCAGCRGRHGLQAHEARLSPLPLHR
jgi:hypothetical protein